MIGIVAAGQVRGVMASTYRDPGGARAELTSFSGVIGLKLAVMKSRNAGARRDRGDPRQRKASKGALRPAAAEAAEVGVGKQRLGSQGKLSDRKPQKRALPVLAEKVVESTKHFWANPAAPKAYV